MSDYLNRTGSIIVLLTLMMLAVILSTQFSFGRMFATRDGELARPVGARRRLAARVDRASGARTGAARSDRQAHQDRSSPRAEARSRAGSRERRAAGAGRPADRAPIPRHRRPERAARRRAEDGRNAALAAAGRGAQGAGAAEARARSRCRRRRCSTRRRPSARSTSAS